MADWTYSESAHRYRHGPSGQFLSNAAQQDIYHDFQQRRGAAVTDLAEQVAAGDLSVSAWERAMRSQIKSTFGASYLYGRGGRNAMAADDWTRLGEVVQRQMTFLHGFAQDLADGKMSAAQIRARSGLYTSSALGAEQRGHASSWGLSEGDLPHVPGDGSCLGGGRCRCSLDIHAVEDGFDVYWRTSSSACNNCNDLSRQYSPLHVGRGGD